MSLDELSPRERQIYYHGFREGKKEENEQFAYFIVALSCLLVLVVKLLIDKN